MASVPDSLRVALYVNESTFPQFVKCPFHAGTGTVAECRHGADVYRTSVPAAAAGSQIAVHRELYRRQTAAEQRGVHLKWLFV